MNEALWRWNGLLLGYPDCCVAMFCERGRQIFETGSSELGTSFKNSDGQDVGYLMCDDCVQRSRQELIDDINNHRYPAFPVFPEPAHVANLHRTIANQAKEDQ